MIRAPVVIRGPGNLKIFLSVDDAERYMEPIDVKSGEYEAYDSEGRLLEMRVSAEPHRFFGFIKYSVEHVRLGAAEDQPRHANLLRDILREYLGDLDAARPDELRDATLGELLARARPLALTR